MTPEPLPEAPRKCPLLAPPALQVSPAPEVPPGASSLSPWTLDQGCRHPGPRARAGNHTASSEPLKPLSGRKLPTTLSVSGLWPPHSLYGPFTVLGPWLQTGPPFVREGGARQGPACWLWPTRPTFPRGRPWTPCGWARSGGGHSRPGPDATLPGPSVITCPGLRLSFRELMRPEEETTLTAVPLLPEQRLETAHG